MNPLMFDEVGAQTEAISTLSTPKGLLIHMDFLMVEESCTSTEAFSACGAGKGFLFCVGFVVSSKV